MRPASAALSSPARGTSFPLIEKVSMRGHFYRTEAEGHLTPRPFGQILGRIERPRLRTRPRAEDLTAAVIVNRTTGRGTFEPLK